MVKLSIGSPKSLPWPACPVISRDLLEPWMLLLGRAESEGLSWPGLGISKYLKMKGWSGRTPCGCCGWQMGAMGPAKSQRKPPPGLTRTKQCLTKMPLFLGKSFPFQHKPGSSASFPWAKPQGPPTSGSGGRRTEFFLP